MILEEPRLSHCCCGCVGCNCDDLDWGHECFCVCDEDAKDEREPDEIPDHTECNCFNCQTP